MNNSTPNTPILDDDAVAELTNRDVCDHNCAMLTPAERDALCATVRAERERADSNYAAYDRVKGLYSETVNQLKQVTKERNDARTENERLASQLKQWQEEKDTKAGYM